MPTRWNDSQPIYWQLKEQTVAMILDGTLAEGEPLPSVRTVASEFQLNPITVSKSYQALVEDGLVEKRRGLGMFVCDGARAKLIATERAKFLEQDQVIRESYDPYVMVRDAWLQNREYKIYDGDPPLADYESYLEDPESPEPR